MRQHSLTVRQRAVLDYLEAHALEQGRAASYREIARALGMRSATAAFHHVNTLERKGYLTRRAHGSRGISLCRRPRVQLRPDGRIALAAVWLLEEGEALQLAEEILAAVHQKQRGVSG